MYGILQKGWCYKKVHVMLQGVQALHAQGRAHCDVKPQNIRVLLSKEGQVLQCTLHGLAGSVAYEGKPIRCQSSYSVLTSCPCVN